MIRNLCTLSVAVVTAGLLGACGDGGTGTVAAPPGNPGTSTAPVSQAPSSPNTPLLTGRPAGEAACRALRDAVRAGTLAQPDVVQGIVSDAGRSSMVFVKAGASRLGSAYDLYQKEKGKTTEAARVETLKARGVDMLRSCRSEGISTD